MAIFVTSGSFELITRGERYPINSGEFCVWDTKSVWDFSCEPATHLRAVAIPRNILISRLEPQKRIPSVYVNSAGSLDISLLASFLHAMERCHDMLCISADAQQAAFDACATLLASILKGPSSAGLNGRVRQETLRAAKDAIEANLDRHDLSPMLVAQEIRVSVRTLHRAFSASGESVMAFARRRRIQRAHDDLIASDKAAGISEIAARWQFSDASHFIRQFKATFGASPAVYLKNREV